MRFARAALRDHDGANRLAVSRKHLLRFEVFSYAQYLRASLKLDNLKFNKDRPVTLGSVCGIWMKRFITVTVAVVVCVSFVEGMTRGLFVSALSMLGSASTAPSVAASESFRGLGGRPQRSRPAEQVQRNDDGYVEGLATTLGYQSPELMATGSIRSGHTMAQR